MNNKKIVVTFLTILIFGVVTPTNYTHEGSGDTEDDVSSEWLTSTADLQPSSLLPKLNNESSVINVTSPTPPITSSSNSSSTTSTTTTSTTTTTTLVPSTTTSTTTTTTTTSTTTEAMGFLMLTNPKDFHDAIGVTYNYYKTYLQLFILYDGSKVFLDTSNHMVSQFQVRNDFVTHNFLNLIVYYLEKNSNFESDNQIVFRHELSLRYFCMTNCGKVYMSVVFTTDCIFVKEMLQEIDYGVEKIRLKKRLRGHKMYTIDMGYGYIDFTEENKAFVYTTIVNSFDTTANHTLGLLMDEANGDLCVTDEESIDYDDDYVDFGNGQDIGDLFTKNVASALHDDDNVTFASSVNMTYLTIGLVLSCVSIIGIIVFVIVYKQKNKYRISRVV